MALRPFRAIWTLVTWIPAISNFSFEASWRETGVRDTTRGEVAFRASAPVMSPFGRAGVAVLSIRASWWTRSWSGRIAVEAIDISVRFSSSCTSESVTADFRVLRAEGPPGTRALEERSHDIMVEL